MEGGWGGLGQEAGQEGILTRADLPTPPEPKTTSLYSRMVGSLHQTAKQSALDKWGEKQNGTDKLRKVRKRETYKFKANTIRYK